MTSDAVAMTEEQVQQYRQVVAALVATSLQRLRDYPLPATDDAEPLDVAHE